MTGGSGVKRIAAGLELPLHRPARKPGSTRIPKVTDHTPVACAATVPGQEDPVTVIDDYAELSRLAEELRALQAVQNAAGDLGRARRYGWPEDRQAILAETLAAARVRLTAVKNGTGESMAD